MNMRIRFSRKDERSDIPLTTPVVRKKPGIRFFILLGISILTASLNLIRWHPVENSPCVLKWEKYDEQLAGEINSINKLIAAADAYSITKDVPADSIGYWDNLSDIIRVSFSHGYSYYSMNENWVAAIAGAVIWDDLAAIVQPNDIMKYPNAACSQQSIVLMECLKRKGIPYRAVLFAHHYAVEAYINNGWRFFDNNLEIVLAGNTHSDSYEGYAKKGELTRIYRGILGPQSMSYMLGSAHYGAVSAEPAPNAATFHHVTRFLSLTLWLIPFGLAVSEYQKVRKRYRLAEARLLLRRSHNPVPQRVHGIPGFWNEEAKLA